MNLLSREVERELVARILEAVESYLEARERLKNKTGLLTRQEIYDDLEINANTLARWERLGLKRYTPPIENSKKVFYRVTDLLKFLEADR